MASGGWTVTGLVSDQFDYGAGRDPVVGTRVSFITAEGHRGTVFVADDHLTADNAKTLIDARAAVLADIGNLSSGG